MFADFRSRQRLSFFFALSLKAATSTCKRSIDITGVAHQFGEAFWKRLENFTNGREIECADVIVSDEVGWISQSSFIKQRFEPAREVRDAAGDDAASSAAAASANTFTRAPRTLRGKFDWATDRGNTKFAREFNHNFADAGNHVNVHVPIEMIRRDARVEYAANLGAHFEFNFAEPYFF